MNDKRIDLHMHSHYSDGVHAPSVLVDLAKWKGISAISLSDHDSLEGYPELATAAEAAGIAAMTGVELSCEHAGPDLHVLAYGADFDIEIVCKLLRKGYVPLEIPVNYQARSFEEGKKVRIFRDPLTWLRAIWKYRSAPVVRMPAPRAGAGAAPPPVPEGVAR